jgi:hypothetical protein
VSPMPVNREILLQKTYNMFCQKPAIPSAGNCKLRKLSTLLQQAGCCKLSKSCDHSRRRVGRPLLVMYAKSRLSLKQSLALLANAAIGAAFSRSPIHIVESEARRFRVKKLQASCESLQAPYKCPIAPFANPSAANRDLVTFVRVAFTVAIALLIPIRLRHAADGVHTEALYAFSRARRNTRQVSKRLSPSM